jgi:hypothetical protein
MKFEPEPPVSPGVWHWIHDFVLGFGYYSPGRETVHGNTGARYLYASDVANALGEDLGAIPREHLDSVYLETITPLAERQARRQRWADEHPVKLDKLLIPRVNKEWPNLRDIFSA